MKAFNERVLNHPTFGPAAVLKSRKLYDGNGERVFSEPYTADMWPELEQKVGGNILAIKISSDATLVSTFNGQQVHPVWATPANVPTSLSDLDAAKVLVGFIPTNSEVAASKKMMNSKPFKRYMHACKMEAMRAMYDHMLENTEKGVSMGSILCLSPVGCLCIITCHSVLFLTGVRFGILRKTGNKNDNRLKLEPYILHPVILCHIGDHMESQPMTGVALWKTPQPCRECHLPESRFHLHEVGEVRTKEKMAPVYEEVIGHLFNASNGARGQQMQSTVKGRTLTGTPTEVAKQARKLLGEYSLLVGSDLSPVSIVDIIISTACMHISSALVDQLFLFSPSILCSRRCTFQRLKTLITSSIQSSPCTCSMKGLLNGSFIKPSTKLVTLDRPH